MEDKKKNLEKLQAETKEKESVLLIAYSGLLAFSSTCLLATTSIQPTGVFTAISCCAFIVAFACFGTVVVGRIHVLHKAGGLHIGHVIIVENFSKTSCGLGLLALGIGVFFLVLHISLVCSTVFLATVLIAMRHHHKFIGELSTMPPAYKALERINVREPNHSLKVDGVDAPPP